MGSILSFLHLDFIFLISLIEVYSPFIGSMRGESVNSRKTK